jgi:hypothetical protein
LWHIHPDDGILNVGFHQQEAASSLDIKAAQSSTPTLATNIAGQSLQDVTEIAPRTEKTASPPSATEDAHTQQLKEPQKEALFAGSNNHEVELVKPSDDPMIISKSTLAPEAKDEDDLSNLTGTLKASTENVEE